MMDISDDTKPKGLKLIEVLERRYGVSILGAEHRLMHLARDWTFLTEPAPECPHCKNSLLTTPEPKP